MHTVVHKTHSAVLALEGWAPNPVHAYSQVSPIRINRAYSEESVDRLAAWAHKPLHAYSQVNPIRINGAYTQENEDEITAWEPNPFAYLLRSQSLYSQGNFTPR